MTLARTTCGFTLIELLVVITVIVVLLALLAPALDRAIDAAETAACGANFHAMHIGTRMYTLDHRRAFMNHRIDGGADDPNRPGLQEGLNERWWATLMFPYGLAVNHFRCPAAGSTVDFGRQWQWDFDQHNVGYGYNGYMLAVYVHDQSQVPYSLNARTNMVKVPADNIIFADSHPRADSGHWSQSIWWQFSSAHPANDGGNEGVSRNRHGQGSNVAFNDGHYQTMFYDDDAPLGEKDPINPNDSNVTNDQHSVRYWDPLRRPELGP